MLRLSSPHHIQGTTTAVLMKMVCMALLPGITVSSYFFGWGVLLNCLLCCIFALVSETIVARLRKRPINYYLNDYSALLTALLLALTLPPYSPWWLLLIGSFFAIVVAKQLFGGLGNNPFNPAMVGYVVLLISFPLQTTIWPVPNMPYLSLTESLAIVADLQRYTNYLPEGYSGATALDIVKHSDGLMLEQLYQQQPIFSQASISVVAVEWVNLAFLLGGLFLLYKRIISWHAPAAFIATLTLCASFGYDNGSSESYGSITMHLLAGATMLGAFFIITDPSSGCTSNLGRLIFGAACGLLTYIIRIFGQYPDGVAFAVLLLNFAAPFIDYYTQPRSYGHQHRKKRDLSDLG